MDTFTDFTRALLTRHAAPRRNTRRETRGAEVPPRAGKVSSLLMPHRAHTSRRLDGGRGVAAAAAVCLILLACVPARGKSGRGAPTPTPSPPVVELQAVPSRESVERGEEVTIFLFASNKSDATLKNLSVDGAGDAFEIVPPAPTPPPAAAAPPAEIQPFGSSPGKLVIKPRDGAGFTTHKYLLTLNYTWDAGGRAISSAQRTAIAVQVRRRFEEEAKGFPGGTAAFLYLLLPIIPLLLSYQLVEGLRTGKGARLPTFSTEHIVPAFFLAVILNLLVLLAAKREGGLDYSNPRVFMSVLFGSFVAGALFPFGHWMWNLCQSRRWGFKNTDSLNDYLRKALLSPRAPAQYTWATGTVGGEEWQGILLEQPNGVKLLGARVEVVPQAEDETQRGVIWDELTTSVLAEDGTLHDRQRLVKMVEEGKLRVDFFAKITRGGAAQNFVAVIDEVKDFQRTGGRNETLVLPQE